MGRMGKSVILCGRIISRFPCLPVVVLIVFAGRGKMEEDYKDEPPPLLRKPKPDFIAELEVKVERLSRDNLQLAMMNQVLEKLVDGRRAASEQFESAASSCFQSSNEELSAVMSSLQQLEKSGLLENDDARNCLLPLLRHLTGNSGVSGQIILGLQVSGNPCGNQVGSLTLWHVSACAACVPRSPEVSWRSPERSCC